MLYVIFNSDGSISDLIVGESIQQGDHLTKQVFAKINGLANTDYVCTGRFTLPNGEYSELVATADTDETFGDGYSITLTEAQTLYAGDLKMNLKLVDLQDHILCTYQVTLRINMTSYDPTRINITQAQYNSLIQSLNSYALKTWVSSLYVDLANAQTITGNKTFSGTTTFNGAVTFNGNINDSSSAQTNSVFMKTSNGLKWKSTLPFKVVSPSATLQDLTEAQNYGSGVICYTGSGFVGMYLFSFYRANASSPYTFDFIALNNAKNHYQGQADSSTRIIDIIKNNSSYLKQNATLGEDETFTGDKTFNGEAEFNALTYLYGKIASDIIPNSDGGDYSLGDSSHHWYKAYIVRLYLDNSHYIEYDNNHLWLDGNTILTDDLIDDYVTQNSTNLPTSGAVYNAIQDAIENQVTLGYYTGSLTDEQIAILQKENSFIRLAGGIMGSNESFYRYKVRQSENVYRFYQTMPASINNETGIVSFYKGYIQCDFSAKTYTTSSDSQPNVYTKAKVDELLKNKNQNIIISTEDTYDSISSYLSSNPSKKVYHNGEDVTSEFLSDSLAYPIENDSFQSNQDGIGTDYYIASKDLNGNYQLYQVDTQGGNYDLNNGDIILVEESNHPNRWLNKRDGHFIKL